jgi:hypothetical protein
MFLGVCTTRIRQKRNFWIPTWQIPIRNRTNLNWRCQFRVPILWIRNPMQTSFMGTRNPIWVADTRDPQTPCRFSSLKMLFGFPIASNSEKVPFLGIRELHAGSRSYELGILCKLPFLEIPCDFSSLRTLTRCGFPFLETQDNLAQNARTICLNTPVSGNVWKRIVKWGRVPWERNPREREFWYRQSRPEFFLTSIWHFLCRCSNEGSRF